MDINSEKDKVIQNIEGEQEYEEIMTREEENWIGLRPPY
jgi:hypothetical protein